MATVVDELVLLFNLDTSKFSKAQTDVLAKLKKFEEEAQKHGKGVEENGKRLLDFFTKLKREAVGALAAFAGAREVKEFIANLIQMDAATGRLARIIGISANELAVWKQMVDLTGGSAQDAAASLASISTELNKLKSGLPSSLPGLLSPLGISVRTATGDLKNASQLLFDIQKALAERSISPEQAAPILAQMGIGPDTIYVITQTATKFEELNQKAVKLVGNINTSAQASQGVTEAFNTVSQAVTDVGRSIGLTFGIYQGLTTILDGLAWAATKAADGIKRLNPTQVDWLRKLIPLIPGTGVFGFLAMLGSGKNPVPSVSSGAPLSPTSKIVPIKPGSGVASPAVQALAENLASTIPGIAQFTAFNDPYHAFFNDSHAKGLALDFTLKDPKQSAEVAEAIRTRLSAMGVKANVIDEYLHPSARATGGHIHVGFANAAAAVAYTQTIGAKNAAAVSSVANDNRRSSSTNFHIEHLNLSSNNTETLKHQLILESQKRRAAQAATGPY